MLNAYYYYQSHVEPIKPTPPAPNTLDKWQVERLPYIVQPIGNAWATANFQMADNREILAEPPTPAGQFTVGIQYQILYPTANWGIPPHAFILTNLGVRFSGLNQEHTYVDKYLAYDRYPYPQPRNNAFTLVTGHLGTIFPLPFVAATAVAAAIFPEFPYGDFAAYHRPNYAALIKAAGASQVDRFIALTIDKFGWRDYSIWPKQYPYAFSAYASIAGSVSNTFPLPAAVNIGPISAHYKEYFPQWQKVHQVAQQAILQAHFSNIRPIPFVPAVVTGLPWWQQEVWQQWTAGRFDWERLYSGSVSNIKPIPFIPPPIIPKFCPQIPNPDADTTASTFGGAAQPLQVLFCRICNSGKPLLVRGDYAIWCQDCCAFVSKQDTVMMTVRAPGQLKSIF